MAASLRKIPDQLRASPGPIGKIDSPRCKCARIEPPASATNPHSVRGTAAHLLPRVPSMKAFGHRPQSPGGRTRAPGRYPKASTASTGSGLKSRGSVPLNDHPIPTVRRQEMRQLSCGAAIRGLQPRRTAHATSTRRLIVRFSGRQVLARCPRHATFRSRWEIGSRRNLTAAAGPGQATGVPLRDRQGRPREGRCRAHQRAEARRPADRQRLTMAPPTFRLLHLVRSQFCDARARVEWLGGCNFRQSLSWEPESFGRNWPQTSASNHENS